MFERHRSKHKRDPAPPYVRKMLAMIRRGELLVGPGLWDVVVRHDDGCPALRGGRCRCDPDITIEGGLSSN